MRIFDKNSDFYDYVESIYPDEFVFERGKYSYLLSKHDIEKHFDVNKYYQYPRTRLDKTRDRYSYHKQYLLLQICHVFWVFEITINNVKGDPWSINYEVDYTIRPLSSWTNTSKRKQLLVLDLISFNYSIREVLSNANETNYIKTIQSQIDINNYRIEESFGCYEKNGQEIVRIPLLKELLAKYLDPEKVYLAFDNYFSLEKTEAERRETVGLTNKEKILNHGFDIKTSFRGKNH